MSHVMKPVIAFLIALIGSTIIMTTFKQYSTTASHNEFDYALRTATQDATTSMIARNYLFGLEEETSDFKIDLETTTEQFKESFEKNVGGVNALHTVNEMDVAMSGVVGYRYVYAQYSTGATTVPFSYCYTVGNQQYEFTLGNKVYVLTVGATDPATGKMPERVMYLNDAGKTAAENLPEHFFRTDMTNEEFRDYIVMTRINEFLTVFYSDGANVIAYNADSGLQFNLGTSDYAADDPSVMTKMSAVIDGPGFFAVVDYFDTEIDQMVRILSFGGSELLMKE